MMRRIQLHHRLEIGLFHPITIVWSFTTVDLSTVDPSSPLLQSYTVTPPIKPRPKRLVSMINRQQNLDLALQIFLYAGKFHPNFSYNYDTYHSIIHKLSRARAFNPWNPSSLSSKIPKSNALKIFSSRQSDITASLPFQSYVARGDMGNAKRVFGELLDRGWIPNATTYTVLMNGYCRLGKFNEAVKVMDEIEELLMEL